MDILDLIMAICLSGIIAIAGLFAVGMAVAWCIDKVQGR